LAETDEAVWEDGLIRRVLRDDTGVMIFESL
jgi:hypothetical protein